MKKSVYRIYLLPIVFSLLLFVLLPFAQCEEKLHGEFKNIKGRAAEIRLFPFDETVHLSYDIIVGADGAHSRLRDALGIPCNCMGTAKGMGAAIFNIPSDAETNDFISPTIKKNGFFVRRIALPSARFIFAQSFPKTFEGFDQISQKQLAEAAKESGWMLEAERIAEGKTIIFDNIEVILQQAKIFSDENRSGIVVGDAAATATFFQGKGANTALKTAAVAGEFFKRIQAHDESAYDTFNQRMKETTDALINDSLYLFNP